jgi:hypothetical protein
MRYRLSALAHFMWTSQDEEPQSGQGVTRDINTFGVYVLTHVSPPVGALVQMEIVLPKLTVPGSGMHLQGEGVVLRVEPPDVKSGGAAVGGFAVSVQFHTDSTESVFGHQETSGQVV